MRSKTPVHNLLINRPLIDKTIKHPHADLVLARREFLGMNESVRCEA